MVDKRFNNNVIDSIFEQMTKESGDNKATVNAAATQLVEDGGDGEGAAMDAQVQAERAEKLKQIMEKRKARDMAKQLARAFGGGGGDIAALAAAANMNAVVGSEEVARSTGVHGSRLEVSLPPATRAATPFRHLPCAACWCSSR
jgi:hypothetical protein